MASMITCLAPTAVFEGLITVIRTAYRMTQGKPVNLRENLYTITHT